MIKAALTGGIGCGKSYIAQLFRQRGVPVYDADAEAKRISVTSPIVRASLIHLLGNEIYTSDGVLNKPLLASYLFANQEHASQVNAIIHPAVRADFETWTERHVRHSVVMLESAILFESGFDATVDAAIFVYAPEELRIQRVMQRDACTRQQVLERMRMQMPDEEKQRRCSYTLFSGREDIGLQIEQLLDKLNNCNNTAGGASRLHSQAGLGYAEAQPTLGAANGGAAHLE